MSRIPNTLSQQLRRISTWATHQQQMMFLWCGVLLSAVGLLGAVGGIGAGIALLAAIISLRRSGLLGIVIIHAGTIVNAGAPPLWAITLIALATVFLLLAEFRTLRTYWATVGIIGLTLLGSVGVFTFTQAYGIAPTAGLLLITGGLLLYLIHRYEQLQLGLLSDPNEH